MSLSHEYYCSSIAEGNYLKVLVIKYQFETIFQRKLHWIGKMNG